LGAYSYQIRKNNNTKSIQSFCNENKINHVIIQRIQKLRRQLTKFVYSKLLLQESNMMIPPPNPTQEKLLLQSYVSGMLDNIARKAPPGTLTSSNTFNRRSAYISCMSSIQEPLYIDVNSVLYNTNYNKLPEWVCYENIVRKSIKRKDSNNITSNITIAVMKNVTIADTAWLGKMAKGSPLLKLGTTPLDHPSPTYDITNDCIACNVETKYGDHAWPILPTSIKMSDVIQSQKSSYLIDDSSYRWFARLLLEGKIIPQLQVLPTYLNDPPSIITRKKPVSKVALLVSALSSEGIDTLTSLTEYWRNKNDKFLFKFLKSWIKVDCKNEVKELWTKAVKATING